MLVHSVGAFVVCQWGSNTGNGLVQHPPDGTMSIYVDPTSVLRECAGVQHGCFRTHAQTLYQISSVSRSHRALLSGEITAADIRKDGVFTKALESANDATSIERPVTLSRVSAAQQTASGGPQHARMFIVVRCCGRNIWVGLMLTVSIQRKY